MTTVLESINAIRRPLVSPAVDDRLASRLNSERVNVELRLRRLMLESKGAVYGFADVVVSVTGETVFASCWMRLGTCLS